MSNAQAQFLQILCSNEKQRWIWEIQPPKRCSLLHYKTENCHVGYLPPHKTVSLKEVGKNSVEVLAKCGQDLQSFLLSK